MGKRSDIFIPSIGVRFYERLPDNTLWDVELVADRGDAKVAPNSWCSYQDNIRRKYLYVLSAAGSVNYGIDTSTPGWPSRINSVQNGQHTAPSMNGVNPQPSKAPNPEQVDLEVYIDVEGKMWPRAITKDCQKGRHGRLHPMWGKQAALNEEDERTYAKKLKAKGVVGFDWLSLALVAKDGQPKRYYFLLSPFQLGPAGLKAALSDIGSDGLSLWFDPFVAAEKGSISGPDAAAIKGSAQMIIPVVDPYNYASEIYEHYFASALDAYEAFIRNPEKRSVPGINSRHTNIEANGGTIDDLYFVAGVLANLIASKAVDDEANKSIMDEVLGGYARALQDHASSCEAAARFLSNWMTGPAHAILDRAAIEDLDDPADAIGPNDMAGVLLYWWHKLRLLPKPITGALAARHVLSDTPGTSDNPVRYLFRKFEKAGEKLDLDSNLGKALSQTGDFLPDLVFLSALRIDQGDLKGSGVLDPDKADDHAQRIANIINNLGFLDTEVINTNELKKRSAITKDVKDIAGTQGKNWTKGGLYLWDAQGKRAVNSIKLRLRRDVPGFADAQIKSIKDFESLDTLGKQLRLDAAVKLKNADATISTAQQTEKTVQDLFQSLSNAKVKAAAIAMDQAKIEQQLAEASALVTKTEAELRKASGSTKGSANAIKKAENARFAINTRLTQAKQQVRNLNTKLDKLGQKAVNIEKVIKDLAKKSPQVMDAAQAANQARKTAVDELAMTARKSNLVDDLGTSALSKSGRSAQKTLPKAMAYVSLISFGIDVMYAGSVIGDRHVSASDTGWAVGDAVKGGADLAKDSMKAFGSSATKLITVLGVFAGAYNIVKYSAKGYEGYTADDGTVEIGAALAVFGGALGVMSALGVAAMLTASGIGVLGGILVAAGALIIYYFTDNEWETFAKHSYFSADPRLRSKRWGSGGSDHWLGRLSNGSGDSRWCVRSQRRCIERLLSRYVLSSESYFKAPESWDSMGNIHWDWSQATFQALCKVSFQYLPPNAQLHVSIVANLPASQTQHERTVTLFNEDYTTNALNTGVRPPAGNGAPTLAAHVDLAAELLQPGYISIGISPYTCDLWRGGTFQLKTRLTLADKTYIDGGHTIAFRDWSFDGSIVGNPTEPTLAADFGDATDAGF